MQKREGEEEEDNEGVCGPCCSCRRRGGAGLTDKTVRQTEEGDDSVGSAEMEMGLQTEDWAMGAERCILVWHGGGGDGGEGRENH